MPGHLTALTAIFALLLGCPDRVVDDDTTQGTDDDDTTQGTDDDDPTVFPGQGC